MSEINNIAVLIPTRGLIYGETIWSLLSNLENIKNKIILIIGEPIPDAQNKAVLEALEGDYTHIWMIEDDMTIPDGTLKAMLEMDKDVVCVDYPLINGWSTIKWEDNEIKHCGLGCTLIKREVFDEIEPPWFDTSKSLDAKTGEILDIPMKYGGHDIFFGIKVREAGFKIRQLDGFECGHLRCSDLSRREYNDGLYRIYQLPTISKWQRKGG